MASIVVDGREYEAGDGDNLLHACLSFGLDLPYFCWHPALGSVGACRQCAVTQFKDADDTEGRVVMACMTPVQDGSRIAVEDEQARRFRAGIIELLMLNHPHDCPVCEEGGECHLQDMTVMTGHAYRRTRFPKRTFRNQDLGPCLGHEMNRCITCYRCVRFYRDYAGGTDLHALGTHDRVYFGRERDGTLQSEFSGNLAEVCPTGVFTDKPFANRYTRKWDLRATPSVCVHCAHGCNTSPNGRYGELRRTVNRYNDAVNGYFLCDRGRYGYGFVNAEDRLHQPLVRAPGASSATVMGKAEAVSWIAGALEAGRALGIGSPRASLEANFALRSLVGEDGFHAGVATGEHALLQRVQEILTRGPVTTPTRREVEAADAVLVLGEDVPNTAPRLALSLRQSARNAAFAEAADKGLPEWQDSSVRDATVGTRSPIFIATPSATRLDDIAAATVRAAPQDIARLGFAIAHELDPTAPAVELPEASLNRARQMAQALAEAKQPLVVSGTGSACVPVVEAAANIAWALQRGQPNVRLSYALPECNSMGLALMQPLPLEDALTAVQAGQADTVIVLENDLYRRAPIREVDALFEAANRVMVIDHQSNATVQRASAALPAGTYAESEGTLVSAEGRAQRYFQLLVPEDAVQESWRWLRDLLEASGHREAAHWRHLDDLTAACAETIQALASIGEAAPGADYRLHGLRVPREPHRASGRTAMHADRTVRDPKPPQDSDSALSFTMEGSQQHPPSALTPLVWAPRWNSVQALNKFQDEVGGPMTGGDAGRRLLVPASSSPDYFDSIPAAFETRADQWLLVPSWEVFASEELSAQSAPVAARAPAPYVAINAAAAEALQRADGDAVALELDGGSVDLVLRVHPSLPDDVATVLIGSPGLPAASLPSWGRIRGGGP